MGTISYVYSTSPRAGISTAFGIFINGLTAWLFALGRSDDINIEGAPRKVTEMEPAAVFIRHLVWGPLVFHAGMTNDELPTLKEQCAEILPRAGARLKENGCDWHNVVRVSFMLHKSEKPQSVLDIASAIVPVPLENAEIELVEGYSTPGKLVEIEVTARR